MKRFNWIKNVFSLGLILVLLVLPAGANAQQGKIPPFSMMLTNGKVFKAQHLPLGKPIIIIYFDPTCDHCEKMTKELLNKSASFKKASIAMISFVPIEMVSAFEKKFGLNKHPNIYTGTEGLTYFVRNYYKITTMPFIALYTKNGNLVKEYRKEGALPDLLQQLGSLR